MLTSLQEISNSVTEYRKVGMQEQYNTHKYKSFNSV